MLFGKKIINTIIPYHRAFIQIETMKEDGKKIMILPSIKSAVFFLNRDDLIVFDNMNDLDKLSFVDYDLVNPDDKVNRNLYESFQYFKTFVKEFLMSNENLILKLQRKVISDNNCILYFTVDNKIE